MALADVILLGDSSFDNESYVGARGKSVLRHCQDLQISTVLAAQDGAVISDVVEQLQDIHHHRDNIYVISVGGNDALGHIDLLSMPVTNSFEFLLEASNRAAEFEKDYIKMLFDLPPSITYDNLAICTIYNPNFEGQEQLAGIEALKFFNDIILKCAFAFGASVIDYRLLFSDKKDYANEIEPSTQGGRKIAEAINKFVVTGKKIIH